MFDMADGSHLPPPSLFERPEGDGRHCHVCGTPVDWPDIAYMVMHEDGEHFCVCSAPACLASDWPMLYERGDWRG